MPSPIEMMTDLHQQMADLSDPRPIAASERIDVDTAFARVQPRLLGVARSLVGSEGAEDVVHDTYLVARDRIGQLRDPAAVDAWLTRICIHRCFRLRRRRLHLDRLLPALYRPAASSRLELRELVERLAPRERTIVVLHYGWGYTLAEIAEMLEITHVNARAIISRARRRLVREWLEAEQ